MDTNQAIGLLQNLQATLKNNNVSLQASVEQNNNLILSIQVAIDQLSGILKTQLSAI